MIGYTWSKIPADENTQVDINDDLCYAKSNGQSHFILMDSDGHIFNPLEHRADRGWRKNFPTWQFKRVGIYSFNAYLKYLKTHNQRFLSLTKRELGNG